MDRVPRWRQGTGPASGRAKFCDRTPVFGDGQGAALLDEIQCFCGLAAKFLRSECGHRSVMLIPHHTPAVRARINRLRNQHIHNYIHLDVCSYVWMNPLGEIRIRLVDSRQEQRLHTGVVLRGSHFQLLVQFSG